MGMPYLAINRVYSEQRSNVSENFSITIISNIFLSASKLYGNTVLVYYLLTTVVKEEICVCDAVKI
jgi:hypothetical protein